MEAQTLRPHPRFAGAEVLIAHGMDMVHQGASEGDPKKVVAGLLLVVFCLGAAAICFLVRRYLLPVVGVGGIAAALCGRGGGRRPASDAQPSAAVAAVPLVAVVCHSADGGEDPVVAAAAREGPPRTYL